jgi:signal transduction histidine kinase/DNA-binding response OmpR family regulator
MEVRIRANERSIAFRYVLTLYDDVGENVYYHYMDGLEPGWIADGNQAEVRYAQIPPGEYTFRVKAKGPRKIAAFNELAIPIVVEQYWYLRWWAISLYAIFLALAIGILYKFQLNARLSKEEAVRMKELDHLKTKMYANITHEFRTPLTVILGMNEAARDFARDGDMVRLSHANSMIDRNGRNLLNFVNQMLDLSKLESGLLHIHYTQMDVIAYLKYRIEAFRMYAEEKGVQILFHSEESVLLMDLDEEKLSHILSNLLSNAIKFSPKGGSIHVTVREIINQEKSVLELKIRDTGIGMEADDIDHIFERFYQAEEIQTANQEGTGIGLSLVNELVKLLDGTIDVTSAVDVGTEFTVQLPVTRNAPSAHSVSSQVNGDLPATEQISDGEDERIESSADAPLVLIVEDNPDVAHFISLSIRDDYRTETANNGKEGIDKAIELVPDLIISDIMMPETDGLALCGAVKSDERTSHIPVILLTAKIDQEAKLEGLEHGADAYLAKPFHRKELLIRLRNLLALRAEMQKRYSGKDFVKSISSQADREDAFILKVRSLILDHIQEEDFDVTQLCKVAHLSRAQLHRKLVALTGRPASHFIRLVRLDRAQELLSEGVYNVSEVAYQVGFKTQAHFSRVFREEFGMPPSEYQNN